MSAMGQYDSKSLYRVKSKLTNQVLGAGREAVRVGEVGEEGLDVAGPRGDRAGGDEAVRLLPTATEPDGPGGALDGGGGDLGADGLD